MKTNLEIEYKMLITKDQMNELLNMHSDFSSRTQVNVYYDSLPASLKSKNMGMRIRDFEDKHLFTLKVKENNDHQEYEVFVESNNVIALNHPQIIDLFNKLDIHGPFVESGRLTTHRTVVPYENGELCLDINEYYGIVDYEVEFEITKDPHLGMIEFENILNRIGLIYHKNGKSKIKRCLDAKKKLTL